MEKKSSIVDFHAHILPGVDHGSADLATTKYQLEEARRAGIDLIVATSHFYPQQESVDAFLRRRGHALGLIKEVEGNKAPKILPAAEVLLCPHMDEMPDLDKLCIGGTNMILMEMPFEETWGEEKVCTLERIEKRGMHIVLAHIERYSMGNVYKILKRRIDVQVNVDYIKSFYQRRVVRRCAEQNRVVALGSDIHKKSKAYRLFGRAKKHLEDIGCPVMEICGQILEKHNVE